MHKLWQSIVKEYLLLIRDFGGLMVLFIMPLVLVVTVTIIQDNTFRKEALQNIPIVWLNLDTPEFGDLIKDHLTQEGAFQLIEEFKGQPVDEALARELVLKGKYQLAIIIPKGIQSALNSKVRENVQKVMDELGVGDGEKSIVQVEGPHSIQLIFDPATQIAFKNGVKSSIDNMVSKIETQTIYEQFEKEFELEDKVFDSQPIINFVEINPGDESTELKPNSAQHNVPAWTLFAIFFIVIPLSINIVQEKNQGTYVRMKTSSINYATIVGGKVAVYLVVCLLQFLLMLLVGIYLFPYIELPKLTINGSYFLLFIIALFSGLAAIGFGILLGTVAKTTEQSAPFGATAVVIMAAIGGVWVPIYFMPVVLQIIAKMSPMNWALNGFYDVILRDANLIDILPEISLLALFFIVLLTVAIYYEKVKNTV